MQAVLDAASFRDKRLEHVDVLNVLLEGMTQIGEVGRYHEASYRMTKLDLSNFN